MDKDKDFNIETVFYNWLEACPLARWQVTEEKEMTDHTQVTIRFKVPKKSASEHLVEGEA